MTPLPAAYDALGRRISETKLVDTAGLGTEDDVTATRSFGYDELGRLTSVTLPPVYDPNDPLSDPDDPDTWVSPVYTYTYDIFGNQDTITDPLGHVTTFEYDARGLQTSRTLPDGLTEEFRYDDRGRQTLHISFEHVVTQFLYDPLDGDLIEKRFYTNEAAYDDGEDAASDVFAYSTNAFGRDRSFRVLQRGGQPVDSDPVTPGDQPETTTKQYDPEGRLTPIAHHSWGTSSSASTYRGGEGLEVALFKTSSTRVCEPRVQASGRQNPKDSARYTVCIWSM